MSYSAAAGRVRGRSVLQCRQNFLGIVATCKCGLRLQRLLKTAARRITRPGFQLRHRQVIAQFRGLRGLADGLLQRTQRRSIVPALVQHPAASIQEGGIARACEAFGQRAGAIEARFIAATGHQQHREIIGRNSGVGVALEQGFILGDRLIAATLPLVQLVILGNAFGGKVTGARMGVVDYDHGEEALKIQEAFQSVAANIRTFRTVPYTDEQAAQEDVRTGKIDAAVVIPAQYSRRVLAGESPHIGLVVDNSDQFVSGSLESEMQSLVDALNAPLIQPKVVQSITLDIVELYPYIEYMKFLLAGSVALAMYISVMIGGGMLYIDDKARGVHEGYLVTPITKLELVLGLNIAGAVKAVLSGISLAVIGSLLAGLGVIFHPAAVLELALLIVATSIAFNGMMFLLMVRVEDPLVPRAMFGVLNTLLFFPSGAIYPIAAFPPWLRAIAVVDPFTYAVHGFKAILIKDGGFAAIQSDVLFLFGFGIVSLMAATPLFRRTL